MPVLEEGCAKIACGHGGEYDIKSSYLTERLVETEIISNLAKVSSVSFKYGRWCVYLEMNKCERLSCIY